MVQVLGCLGAVVIVPDSAPKNKIDKMVNESYGLSSGSPTKVIKVPYDRWWRVLESGDPKEELARAINEEKLHQKSLGNVIFIHPVCDQGVLEGNRLGTFKTDTVYPIDNICNLTIPV